MNKILLTIALLLATNLTFADPLFRFGAVADCQYCKETSAVRKYNLSPKKLTACVKHYNKLNLAFVVHLGDFIDRDFENFDVVIPIYNQLKAPHYHVLGNHDFSVANDKKALVPKRMGLKNRYYDFTHKGWRFIALDGNDLSLYAYPKNDPRTKAATAFHRRLKAGTPTWNGGASDQQLKWIESRLKLATQAKERVILFCHFPVYPADIHNLWNHEAVTGLLAKYPCVAAYINGHNHAGNYGKKGAIHYLTLKDMVDTEKSSYSIIEVHKNELKVIGYGRQENRSMPLPLKKSR
ncbi:MAG: metallophosphoesterase [Verrucomicrobiota bacterium]|nr:metallophosphoesterase [Verrucomicrobiota bacterium]